VGMGMKFITVSFSTTDSKQVIHSFHFSSLLATSTGAGTS